MSGKSSKRPLILVTVCAALFIGLLIAVIVIVLKKDDVSPAPYLPQECPSASNLEHITGQKDGLGVSWYTGNITVKEDITRLRDEKTNIVEILLSQTQAGVFVIKGTSITLKESLEILHRSSTLLKIKSEIASTETFIKILAEIGQSDAKVMLTLPTQKPGINATSILTRLIDHSNVTVALDLNDQCCVNKIGKGTLEYFHDLTSTMIASVEVDIRSLSKSWDGLRLALNIDQNLTLIVTMNEETNAYERLWDVLLARNDIDENKLLYNMKGYSAAFKTMSSSAGSPLIYFDIMPRDASKIIWSHNTDTWEQLNAATEGNVMMIEGDIRLFAEGTSNKTDTPIMAHDEGDYNNLSFAQWLDAIIKVDKGMKFDFKSIGAVRPALTITNRRLEINGPIWLNADLLAGPGQKPPTVPAQEFLDAVELFPEATLSIGWTTIQKGNNTHLKYTMDNVQEIHELCRNLSQPVTFPVRAEQFRDSLDEFDWLLSQSRSYTLTIWTGKGDNVTQDDMTFMKGQFERSRVYFDLPVDLRPTLYI
ncbi:protein FAM151A-like [Mya arenaria]|uniref:protein FAM151A-like n=1 Tax=Mya arenaria TaxID=6604 RepID=UPI0022E82D5C|nr:protein FAM151A-like [Mya arenaria]